MREFTIISNNCWGGTVYESYGLPKQSPTVGMFVMPRDFETFDALPLEHKVIFAAKVHPGVACCKRIHCPSKCEFVPASYEPFGRNLSFDTTYYINSCFAEG